LHQVRTRLVGINQMKTVYERVWRNAGEEVYAQVSNMIFKDIRQNDRIARYYRQVV